MRPAENWRIAIAASADPERAARGHALLIDGTSSPLARRVSSEQARVFCALFGGSPASMDLLSSHPGWMAQLENVEALSHPRRDEGYRREAGAELRPFLEREDFCGALDGLRRFRQKEMVRIAARDLARLGLGPELTRELSDLADVCLSLALQVCLTRQSARLGRPYHQDEEGRWHPTPFCVLGLGKLGGRELNYSSDVDVLFLYEEEGIVSKTAPIRRPAPGHGMSGHAYFCRLAEAFIAELSKPTAEGFLYRMDLRLRPEGPAGPLARSLPGYENYYAQSGQTWERLMLGKTRLVAGDSALGAGFLDMIQPFRYPRVVGERMLREIAAVKTRLESEVVKAGELGRNVKLGRGGIREIEFVAQSLQLLHAGRQPFLQGTQTVEALGKLSKYKILPQEDAADLSEAYFFLRDVEHRLQMENNQRTHTIPTARRARERLAALMGFAGLDGFEKALQQRTNQVRRVYDQVLGSSQPMRAGPLPRLDGPAPGWLPLLAERGFRDPPQALRLLKFAALGPGYGHVSSRTTELALELIDFFLDRCPGGGSAIPAVERLSDPDRVLARLDSFISAYGARATLFEAWAARLPVFKLLLLLFDRSEYLAEAAIRSPGLIDEIEQSGRLGRAKSGPETLEELRQGKSGEDQAVWLRKYQQAEFARIALRDILGLAPLVQIFGELTSLADACLRRAVQLVLARRRAKTPPIAVMGLGKLGGSEINYGSDLDVLFVADACDADLAALQEFGVEIMSLLGKPPGGEAVFSVDARLRPDGEKGLLVNSLEACRAYYHTRAELWEIQSLTRVRFVAGDETIGRKFYEMAGGLTDFQKPAVSCHTPGWKQSIGRMRERIEKERSPAGAGHLAIKTGAGGLMDAEFVAQTACLETGLREPNTLRALDSARASGWLPAEPAAVLIENYSRLRRVESVLRRWSFQAETVLPAEEPPLRRVALRCGYSEQEAFLKDIAAWRAAIRAVYDSVFLS